MSSSFIPEPSSTAQPPSSTTSAVPSPTGTGQGQGQGQGGPGNSSPLLFFVALGFGVVFTNLWIIVGVKYCFRYNQRRARNAANADGDAVDLAAMPRPHRRRREKKLMTMEEVNTKFPLTKYKAWRASREDEGLPATGGISVPPSRAQSLKEADGVIPARKSNESNRPGSSLSEQRVPTITNVVQRAQSPTTTETIPENKMVAATTPAPPATTTTQNEKSPITESTPPAAPRRDSDDTLEDEEDDPIQGALVNDPDLLTSSGDTCAICIDVLEDDDDVRGLTCGHAFHGACVDPWLSTRRACCPLCKADYYIPKPRPEGEQRPRNMPQRPAPSWLGDRTRSLIMGLGRNPALPQNDQPPRTASNQTSPEVQQQSVPITQRIVNIRWPFRRRNQQENSTPAMAESSNAIPNATIANTNPTPSQLEAGVR